MVQTVGTVLYQIFVFPIYKIYHSFVQAAEEQRQVGRHTPTPQGQGHSFSGCPKGGQRLTRGVGMRYVRVLHSTLNPDLCYR